MKAFRVFFKTLKLTLIITASGCFIFSQGIIADHNCTNLNDIPVEWIDSAKAKLHIAYEHTSHGSQLVDGMNGLMSWKGSPYTLNNGGSDGALDFHDNAMSSYGGEDLGNPDRTAWADATRGYLNNEENADVNVIMWSWCGQADTDSSNIALYLSLMTQLESEYPEVKFVYMTGHLVGSGVDGNLHQRNEQIRQYCINNNKILFDFADIESYDPDGLVNYNELMANDNCDYDSDGNGSRDANWAENWQNSHSENVDWYSCGAQHSKPLNANMKAYACWYLWAKLAGWESVTGVERTGEKPAGFTLKQNYPNPFNPSTKIAYELPAEGRVTIKIYNLLGKDILTLQNGIEAAGRHIVDFNASRLSSGIYYCRLHYKGQFRTIKMLYLK